MTGGPFDKDVTHWRLAMHSFTGRDFVTMRGVERPDLELVFDVARQMEQIVRSRTRTDLLRDKLLGLMFFQVSTRTCISFQSAMERLGGGVVGFTDPKTTRAGDYYSESLQDTVRMMENYADVLVMRHPQDGAPAQAAAIAGVPVINAGDGYNEHPTQALLDLYTILRERGQLEGVRVGLVGDMRIRVFHSLALGLARYRAKTCFVSPVEASMPSQWKEEFGRVGLTYMETQSLEDVLSELDVIYLLGTKPPSFSVGRSEAMDVRPSTSPEYVVNCEKLARASPDLLLLHPLPRTDELPTEVDEHASQRYFVQAHYGVAVRMALLALIMGRAP